MTITYRLDESVAAKIDRHMTAGGYKSPQAVVDAALDALEIMQADTDALRRLIAEADADVAAGRVTRYADADVLVADILAAGEERSRGEAQISRRARGATSTPSTTTWCMPPAAVSPAGSSALLALI